MSNEAIPQADQWLGIKNAAKRVLAPLAIAAAGVASAVAPSTALAENGPTHPIHPFVDYNQGDWGQRYAETGCGPTSAAMVISTETGRRVTPHKIGHMLTPKFWARGSGTKPTGFAYLAKRFGLTEQHSDLQDAKEILREGGLAIVHAAPGHFTSAGHYMVLKSLYHGRFKLADPNNAPGRDSEVRWWSPRQLKKDKVDDVWTFLPPENATATHRHR